MNMQKDTVRLLIEELSVNMRWLAESGWFPGSSGNFSVFARDEGKIYIKTTGSRASKIDLENIVILNPKGERLSGKGVPSKEYRFHLGIYKLGRGLNAVIHGHPPHATAFALAGYELPIVTGPAKIYLKKIPLVEYAPGGSEELAKYVTEAFRDTDVRAVLLKGHGVVCAGDSLIDVVNIAEWLEDNARSYTILNSLDQPGSPTRDSSR